MDTGTIVTGFNGPFIFAFLSIILINLILSGDNAVVIAMAVRSLPAKQRRLGIAFGTGAAVVLRIGLTFIAAKLLTVQGLKLGGGILIAYVAVKLFVEGAPDEKLSEGAGSLKQAITTIVIADIVMSLDNILGVAGACKGNLPLLIFGLGLSIPFVVFTSGLLTTLMDKYSAIVYIGAMILGRVAGDMIMTDPYTERVLHPGKFAEYAVQIIFAVGVIIVGKLWMKWKIRREEQHSAE